MIIESIVRRRNGSRTARSRTPRARQKTGARIKCTSVRFASRSGRGRSIRPHRCVTLGKHCRAHGVR
eukprot:9287920-Lingulodinium_polyedra.AAC.1